MSEPNSGSDVVSMKVTARKEGELWPVASFPRRPKCFVIQSDLILDPDYCVILWYNLWSYGWMFKMGFAHGKSSLLACTYATFQISFALK